MNTNKHTIPPIKFYKWSVNPVVLQFQCTWRELRTHSMSGCGQNFDLKSIDRCRKWNALKMKFLIYEIYWIFVYLAKFLFSFLMKIFLFLFFSFDFLPGSEPLIEKRGNKNARLIALSMEDLFRIVLLSDSGGGCNTHAPTMCACAGGRCNPFSDALASLALMIWLTETEYIETADWQSLMFDHYFPIRLV